MICNSLVSLFGGEKMYKLVKIFSAIAIVFILLGISIPSEAAKKNVAIIPINNNSDTVQTGSESIIYKLVAENLTNQLVVAFHNSEDYDVIDREKVSKVLSETDGAIEQDKAITIGKKVNAQCSIIGKVVSATVIENRDKKALEAIKNVTDNDEDSENSETNSEAKESDETTKNSSDTQQVGDFEGKISVELKFLNNETGKVIFSDEITSTQIGTSGASALRAACRVAAEGFLSKVAKQTSPETEVKTEVKTETEQPSTPTEVTSLDISVIYVKGDELYIDKGKNAGIKVGDIFIIFDKGVPITDMEGKIITVKTTESGKALVTEANEGHSVCKIIERNETETEVIKRGCTAKKSDD